MNALIKQKIFTYIMSQEYEVQTLECAGVPITEYRYDHQQILITIEFRGGYEADEFFPPQPVFIFTDKVYLRQDILECKESEIDPFQTRQNGSVLGMQLVEFRTSSGELTAEPYWLIGVRWGEGSPSLHWYYECELIGEHNLNSFVFEEF